MAKIKKKGESGQAKNFITRTQAVRKLQISLPDFRRLCIFKGIYPREPRNKKKASKSSTQSTTFYYTKDIQYLLHEPILLKFREHKAFEKKLAKALGRGEVKDAARIEKASKPKISLDHIIKERYPTFVDAIRDLDDALSMLFLFANLPSTSTVPPKTIALCERLCLEFQHYLIITHSLRKSFLSIKGIYYQATIQGQDIMWLVPYKFAQRITEDVDFRIMGTFVEFYTTLLGFVNFRLYTSIGLVYPPKFDKSSDDKGGELGAFTLEGSEMREPRLAIEGNGNEEDDGAIIQNDTKSITQKIASLPPLSELQPDSIADDEEKKEEEENTGKDEDEEDQSTRVIDKFEVAAGGDVDVLAQPAFTESEGPGQLFAPFTFFLGRETPRQPLEFILRSFGCKRVGWDVVLGDGAFVTDENDTRITHQVVDRPQIIPQTFEMDDSEEEENEDEEEKRQSLVKQSTLGKRVPGRTYVQPQWVWDCINAGKLLRPDQYAPGAELPPHLSPWVKPGKGQYDPAAPLAAQERVGEAEGLASGSEEISDEESEASSSDMGENKGTVTITEVDEEDIGGMTVDISANSEDEFEEDEEWDGLEEEIAEESEDEATKEHALHQRELEAEAAGLPFLKSSMSDVSSKTKVRDEARKKAARKRKEEEEELERQKMMMSRKKRKILDKMLYSNKRKDDEAEALRAKRRKLEKIASGT